MASTAVREGSLGSLQVSDALAKQPGKGMGFYNVKQIVRRDLCVLSCAVALRRRCRKVQGVPFRALDAFASSGVQGLRLASECPVLVRDANSLNGSCGTSVPELAVVLNDEDANACALCAANALTKQEESGREEWTASISIKNRRSREKREHQPNCRSTRD